ncbi:MAG: sulfatase-like hydrolase/transferase [Opitutaceae bacterium]|nr:sulfatase-like hydrolase/transferase [Opitutaceae bacterium]
MQAAQGGKADLYEAGIRVPFIISMPGIVPASTHAEPVLGTDLFPTLLDFAFEKIPKDLDGRSLQSALVRNAAPVPAHPILAWHFPTTTTLASLHAAPRGSGISRSSNGSSRQSAGFLVARPMSCTT